MKHWNTWQAFKASQRENQQFSILDTKRSELMTNRYDAIIIGTGQAGPSLAGRLTAAGMKVAIVERKRFGGTCVNNGCIPTKALVASDFVQEIEDGRTAVRIGKVFPLDEIVEAHRCMEENRAQGKIVVLT